MRFLKAWLQRVKPRRKARPQGLALALGGGGVKGYAHLGFLSVLEEAQVPVVAVAGTSIGAWIGALWVAGRSAQDIMTWFRNLPPEIIRQRRPEDRAAYWGFAGFEQALTQALAPYTRLEDLPKPFGVTAVDLHSGRLVYLVRGPLVRALLASAALPGVFPPVPWDDSHLLVDGGVLDNVPVRLARFLAPKTPVVAVVLTATPEEVAQRPMPRVAERIPFLGGLLERLSYIQAMSVFLRTMEFAGSALTFARLQLDAPEVLARLPVGHISSLERHVDAEALWERGRQVALEMLPKIQQALQQPACQTCPGPDAETILFLE